MRDVARAFLRSPGGAIGLALLVGVVLVAAFAPLIAPADPWEMVGAPFEPPLSPDLPLGSDTLGRDIAAGLVHGARVSLAIGLASSLAALLVGVVVGALAGWFGGLVDDALMRLAELFQTIPGFILAVLLVATLGPSLGHEIAAIAAISWPPLARLTRGEFLRLKGREFVRAAICQGERPAALVLRHILPNAVAPIIVTGSLTVATAILIESALSFLGLGDPNLMSWGYMIGAARTVIRQAWWTSVFPGAAILLTVLAINLVGEALNDALNPRLARGRT